jgi:hypothetical protein
VTPERTRVVGPVLIVLVAWAALVALALSTVTGGDYIAAGPVSGDNPGPAIAALAHGDLAGLVARQPAMGLTSIVLRAPFAAAAPAFGGGNLMIYRLGAFACLLVLGAFAIWLAARPAPPGVGRLTGALAGAAILLSPITLACFHAGHPEEILAAALATGAMIAALHGRPGWAAVMLGLAVGTKEWALIAALPVLIALPERRWRSAAVAGAVGLLLTASLPLADPAAFARASNWVGGLRDVNPSSLWWALSKPIAMLPGGFTDARILPLGLTRSTASMVDLAIVGLGAAVIWARTRRHRRTCDALALLALLGLVRCAGDPVTLGYYYVALLVPLAAWEAVGLGRAPLVTVLTTAGVAFVHGHWLDGAPVARNLASIAFTLIVGGYLIHASFGVEASPHSAGRLAAWRPRPATGLTEV